MEQFNCEGFDALSMEEMGEIEGGNWIKTAQTFLKKNAWGIAISTVIAGWDDIKEGLAEGWKAGGK